MKCDNSRKRVVLLAAVLLGVGAVGCELALDFDRTKIDGGGIDASFGDTTLPDQITPPVDAPPDNIAADGGPDAPADAPADSPPDTGDAGADTGADAADAADSG